MSKISVYKDVKSQDHLDPKDDCFEYKTWKILKESYGGGSYGSVHKSCHKTKNFWDCNYAAKIIKLRFNYDEKYVHNFFLAEAKISKYASNHGFGVPVFTYYLCNNSSTGIIIMEKFDGNLSNITLTKPELKNVLQLVCDMHDVGVLHRDLFGKNVMYKTVSVKSNPHKEFRIIDFGMAIAFKKIPDILKIIDFINLIDSLVLNDNDYNYAVKFLKCRFGKELYYNAVEWYRNHKKTCKSEYYLLENLPEYVFKIYGPAIFDLLAWSVYCNKSIEQDINYKITKKLEEKKISYKIKG